MAVPPDAVRPEAGVVEDGEGRVRPQLATQETGCSSTSLRNKALVSPRWASAPRWVQEDQDESGWGYWRLECSRLLDKNFQNSEANVLDTVMGIFVVINIVLMIQETDFVATCVTAGKPGVACVPFWMVSMNWLLLFVYTLEVGLRMFVLRGGFFFIGWNLLDLGIVLVGLAGGVLHHAEDFARLQLLRIVRVARVLRVAKLLNRFPTLKNLIMGFSGAMQAMFWGLLLILLLLTMWSILAVEVIHPINIQLYAEDDHNWCAEAFSTVLRATLLFFQTLVAGDSWGQCAIPIINKAPLLYVIFALSLVTVQLGFTNLVLAVVVDKAAEAREGNKESQLEEKRKGEARSIEMWREIMRRVDTDGSGTVNMEELLEGFQDPTVRTSLELLNIGKDDFTQLFDLLDKDGSGDVRYEEFVAALHNAFSQDPRLYMMMVRLQLSRMEAKQDLRFARIEGLLRRSQKKRSSLADPEGDSDDDVSRDTNVPLSVLQYFSSSVDLETESPGSGKVFQHNVVHCASDPAQDTLDEIRRGYVAEATKDVLSVELPKVRSQIETQLTTLTLKSAQAVVTAMKLDQPHQQQDSSIAEPSLRQQEQSIKQSATDRLDEDDTRETPKAPPPAPSKEPSASLIRGSPMWSPSGRLGSKETAPSPAPSPFSPLASGSAVAPSMGDNDEEEDGEDTPSSTAAREEPTAKEQQRSQEGSSTRPASWKKWIW